MPATPQNAEAAIEEYIATHPEPKGLELWAIIEEHCHDPARSSPNTVHPPRYHQPHPPKE